MNFPTDYASILSLLDQIDPLKYEKNRNFIDGNVSRLSPYVSRGVISTRQIARFLIEKGYDPHKIESYIRELAWRDYFQLVWKNRTKTIDSYIKQAQTSVNNHLIPKNIVEYNTGIEAIDKGIKALYDTGYMHNHLRMYTAALSTNIAKSHWYLPAKWMYYHLLDADWGSNALSWQWVAGSFSSKKYYANQENINRYCYTEQKDTFLDTTYEALAKMEIPTPMRECQTLELKTRISEFAPIKIDAKLPVCIYNFYNLDPLWMNEIKANRILLLEPQFFEKYPVSEKVFQFFLKLSKNIPDLQCFVGSFDELYQNISNADIHYKEHPTVTHYKGTVTPRDWLFENSDGYYPSFFTFWKKYEKQGFMN